MSELDQTTWDGKPVSAESPHGVSIVVYRKSAHADEFLILHRAQNEAGVDDEGDWAWTPPSGARYPGEDVDECARRELQEETGLALPIISTPHGSADWFVYAAEGSTDDVLRLDEEHDRFLWTTAEVAAARCLPDFVSDKILAVAADLCEASV